MFQTNPFRTLLLAALLAGATLPLSAQGARVGFGNADHDSSLPVEVTADQLDLDQAAGTARFTGNVVVGQGEMRLTGAIVDVEYGETATGTTEITRLHATGGVTLFNGSEAAEGQEAVYTVATGAVVMTGDVVLTQGENAVAGEKLTVDLESGTGVMEGRVRVVFKSSDQTGGAAQ